LSAFKSSVIENKTVGEQYLVQHIFCVICDVHWVSRLSSNRSSSELLVIVSTDWKTTCHSIIIIIS